jgi:hypothetical protein
MPRQGGKSAIGAVAFPGQDGRALSFDGGWLDESQAESERELERSVIGLMRVLRNSREMFPKFNPRVTMRPETWDRIKGNMRGVETHLVAHLAFPREAFYSSLLKAGASVDALAHFGQAWLDSCCDAQNRLYPGMAFDALRLTCGYSLAGQGERMAKWRGIAEAAKTVVLLQPDLAPWLARFVRGDKFTVTGRQFSLPYERALIRIHQARRSQPPLELPLNLSRDEFIRYGEHAGIWRVNNRKHIVFAPPYSVGMSLIHTTLTDAAISRMLRE